MAKSGKTSSTPKNNSVSKPKTDQSTKINYNPKGIIKEGYQPTNTVDTSVPPKQNNSEKKG